MRRLFIHPIIQLPFLLRVVAAFLAVVAVLTIAVVAGHAHADSTTEGHTGTLITIHDRGVQKVIVTREKTIGDALKEAGITLDKQDVVEPSLDQKLVSNDYQVNIYRARPVTVVDGDVRERVMTAYQTADQIANSVGIKLYPEDKTAITRSDDIVADGAGLELVITRAIPLHFMLYGQETDIRTQGKTVGDMLKEKNITLGASDRVSPDPSTPITADMTVTVWREGKQTITVAEPVNFDTQQIQDANQPIGYDQVQTPGQNGSQNVTYEIDIVNGQEVSRTQIASIVTTPATTQTEVIGTKFAVQAGYSDQQSSLMTQAGISADQQQYAAYIIDHENGMWCPTRWQGQNVCPAGYIALHDPSSQVGYGLCQSTPAIKMATAGADWATNPVTQLIWCGNYATSRYGSWEAAAEHWASAHSW